MLEMDGSEPSKALVARPNLASLTAEVQVEVANSPAYQCLEQSFSRGALSGTEVALLKMKYAQLYEALTISRDNEYNLLQMSKRFIAVLEVQQADLAKSDQFPDNISTNVSRIRSDFLRTENTLMAGEERVEKLTYNMSLLKDEKRLLQREYSRMPKSELDILGDEDIIEAMLKRSKTLSLENQELSIEIDKIKRKKYKGAENLRIILEQEQEVKESKQEILELIEKTDSELFTTSQLPGQYSKEYEKLRRHNAEAEKENLQSTESLNNLTAYHDELLQATESIQNEIGMLKNTFFDIKKDNYGINFELEDVGKNFKIQREEEMNNRTEKATQELDLQNLLSIKKEYLESILKLNKDKDKLTKSLKTAILQQGISSESLYQTKQIHEKVRNKYEMFPKDDVTWYEKRLRLNDEVSTLKIHIEQEAKNESIIFSKVQQSVGEADRKLFNLNSLRSESVEMVKLAMKIADKRENAANDFLRAERQYKKIKEELDFKNEFIFDQKKELSHLEIRATKVARIYSEIKMERNKCVALLQLTNQAHLEHKEKLKLQLNEQGITYMHLNLKEKTIVDLLKETSTEIVDRDNIRNEICKVSATRLDQNYKREVMRLNIQRLNNMFNKIEADIVQTKKLTEKNILFRNERAMQLIERNEDVYILDERTKIQDSRYRNAEIELQGLIEEISCYNRYKNELTNLIHLIKKKIPMHKELDDEVKNKELEYTTVNDYCNSLIKRVEDPNALGRLRFLEGRDLDTDNMQHKVNIVEIRLINKEEQLLEKDLLYEAVSRLVDQVQLRSVIGKDDTIKVAKSVNHIKSKIMLIDKQLKVRTAELTIKMTETNNLHKDILMNNHDINRQYRRLEMNIPPSLEVKNEYLKKETHKKIKEDYKRTKDIKKKIIPKPPASKLFYNPRAFQNRLPPIRKFKKLP